MWHLLGTRGNMATYSPPTFRVLSRLDLKVATGGFKEAERLGVGPRCVAFLVPAPNELNRRLVLCASCDSRARARD